MAEQFRLPDPGEGIHEAEIVEVVISAGDEVNEDDPLFTIETDKAQTDVPSPFTGRIAEVAVAVGDLVEVGDVLLSYEEATSSATDEGVAEPEGTEPDEPEAEQQAEEPEVAENAKAEQPGDEPSEEPEPGAGSSDGGQEEAAAVQGPDAGKKPATAATVRAARPVPASPATRALAKRLEVDLHEIEGSGPDGRIEPEDVKAAANASRPSRAAAGERAPAETEGDAAEATVEEAEAAGMGSTADRPGGTDDFGPVVRAPVRGVRRATAKHMTTSWHEIPHVTHHDVADITALEAFRTAHADEVEAAGGKLTLTVFLMKAAIAALREHPRFNASLDGDDLVLKQYYNIGVAVDSEDGLLVPVIRDADRKPMIDLSVELVEVAERMRAGVRTAEDLRGGTFTITNPGGIGGTAFTPIINHPEVAILGAARARQVPTLHDGGADGGRPVTVRPRLQLPLVVAFDHRVNDGADAARFMRSVVEFLEDVPGLLLHG